MFRIRVAAALFAAALFVAPLLVVPLLVVPLLVMPGGAALAHTDEYFDAMQTPHGGQVRMAGPYHLELVVGPREVLLYVSDHGDDPIATAEGSAKVIIRSGRRNRYVVVLMPAGDNLLRGNGEFKLGKANDVSVLLALPGKDPQRAQFRVDRNGKPLKAAQRKTK
jgi:hypothetical protein